MKLACAIAVLAGGVMFLCGPARGDWDEGGFCKMHYPQLPDLGLTGVDVDTIWTPLADDFRCTQTGPILDIHIWGSFADDILPVNGLDWMCFLVKIRADVPDPDGPGPLYSMPGDELWSRRFCGPEHGPENGFTVRKYADDLQEWWYDPATNLCYFPGDTECYQYNLYVNAEEAFPQEAGKVYWLEVQGWAVCQDATFGWKSSLNHWSDDAVWQRDGIWVELRYPVQCYPTPPHPLAGQSMDLAFVITPEPSGVALLLVAGAALLRRRRSA